MTRPAKSKSGSGPVTWPLDVLDGLSKGLRSPRQGRAPRQAAPSTSSKAKPSAPAAEQPAQNPSPQDAQPPAQAGTPARGFVPKPVAKPTPPSRTATPPDSTQAAARGSVPVPSPKPMLSPAQRPPDGAPAFQQAAIPTPSPAPAPDNQAKQAEASEPEAPEQEPARTPLINVAGKSDPLDPALRPVDRAGKVAGPLLAPVGGRDIPTLGDRNVPVPRPRPAVDDKLRPSLPDTDKNNSAPIKQASLDRLALPRPKPLRPSQRPHEAAPPQGNTRADESPRAPVTAPDTDSSTESTTSWPAADVASAKSACAVALAKLDIEYKAQGPIGGPGGCGTAYSIEVTRIAGVALKPAATMNCKLAAAMHQWIVTSVQPNATKMLGEKVTGIGNASSYVCRRRYGAIRGKLSEHAYADAFDVGAFFVASGKPVGVMSSNALIQAGFSAKGPASFLDSVRSDACQHFSTVLGPGYNEAHATHFHFDLGRGGRYLICK